MSAGQIHDLGYQRYLGPRRAQGTRWVVIARQQLGAAWRGWWRYKLWLIASVIATAIAIAVLYLLSNRLFQMLSSAAGKAGVSFADGMAAVSLEWYCKIAFIVSLTIGSAVVATDLSSGAFTFYFARSVRPRDYVLGKLAGLAALMGLVTGVGPLLLGLARLGLSDSPADALAHLAVVIKAAAIGALATGVYAAVPLGFSALAGSRRNALALWAGYYVLIGSMAQAIGLLGVPSIAALDLATALKATAYELFGLQLTGRAVHLSLGVAIGSVVAHVGLAIAVVGYRVRAAQRTGVGGAG